MQLDPTTRSPGEVYRLLIGCITPRPIAWVSSVSPAGVTNLAPFSFFSGVSARPPALMFSCVNRRDGSSKDTVRNIEATGEFVVQVATFDQRRAVNDSSAELAYETSEIEACGLTPLPSRLVAPPRIAESPVQFECRLNRIVRLGDGALAANVVIGEILLVHVDDAVLSPDGSIDPAALDARRHRGPPGAAAIGPVYAMRQP